MNSIAQDKLRIVIVGGVAGGASAAARARRVNANAEITVLEKGPDVSFANCGLPYHLGGEIAERDKLLVATPELFWDRFRIRVRTHHEVTLIDRKAKTVTGRTSNGDEFKVPYDKLILSTGSQPIRPEFCNVQAENLFQLWTLEDMDRILAYMKRRPCKRAVVVGAGFVGLEVVEQLCRLNVQVVLLERLPQVLGPIDPEMAKLIEQELIRHGVKVQLQADVQSLLTNGQQVTAVKLAAGDSIAADLVIVGAGVRPRTELAEQTGLELGATGCVAINEYCQTNDPDIYAVGDMVQYMHGVLQAPARIPLAAPANRAGRVAGTHAAGGQTPPLSPVQVTAIVRVFELAAGGTGLNSRACQGARLRFRTATIQAGHHAGYFPGARNLTLKLLYEVPSGRILGAQAVGAEGVDKRLDVVATLLHFGGHIDDLAGLDLAYAPPFGSAKDPIHMLAFAAQNDMQQYPELEPFDTSLAGKQLVDVRSASELAKLPLPGAMHIPIDELAERWQELDPTQPTVTICHSGKRGHVAACWLRGKGFADVKNLNGGVSIRQLAVTDPTGSCPQSNDFTTT
jgi:NADPH-dependent 2,4-dienoyl-CoA reductase/sulfur reductase-like enzyme/rhodanese-related sulfurtransferase